MDAITVFVKVVEAGNFSAAARRLGMPKTTVSAKVAGLEKRLGVRLIQRNTRRLRMTEAGDAYFQHCAIAVREVEKGEAELQSTKSKPSGVLKVTAPVDLGHAILPRIARAYAAQCPDVSLQFILTNRIVDIVEEGVDVAIRFAGTLKDSSLIARRFIEIRSDLWASPQYMKRLGKPNHPRDLADAEFITYPFQRGTILLTNGKSDFMLEMKGRVQADDVGLVNALTVLGEGIAWLPDYLTAELAKAGKLVQVLSEWRPKQVRLGTIYFVYAGRQYALPKVETFIQTALGQVQPGK
ncbi:LysR family transcriptional regulator [Bradyrhizobium sp. Arg68]|uniref:LysR family transcriptional regulator n=1 Tax=Bradyrhizobium ivorense TaxID=2511166 RepID=UPI001E4A6177|nr:LysR family transcriptional regulator [Bradyrhizobium ivorense]MCC8937714.1 LysR family transcriptional regulator [Bradyrhizobium ivorense]